MKNQNVTETEMKLAWWSILRYDCSRWVMAFMLRITNLFSHFKRFFNYYWPVITASVLYLIIFFVSQTQLNGNSVSQSNMAIEISKQYVIIMSSLCGISLFIMGFLIFEFSYSRLKSIDINLHEKDQKVKWRLINQIQEANERRKDTISVFLVCFIITLLGAMTAAVGTKEQNEIENKVLSLFIPSAVFMILSVVFLLIGLARIIDEFQINKIRKPFTNLCLILMLIAWVEISGTISDATNSDWGILQFEALFLGLASMFISTTLFNCNFEKRPFIWFSFWCIIFGTSAFLYTELYTQYAPKQEYYTNPIVGYIILGILSTIIGCAFSFIRFDRVMELPPYLGINPEADMIKRKPRSPRPGRPTGKIKTKI